MKRVIRTKYYILRFLSKLLIVLLLIPILYNYIPIEKGDSSFYIPSSDVHTIIDTLKEHGYGVSNIDKLVLRFIEAPPKGWYLLLDAPTTRFKFFEALVRNHDKIIGIKIYAGETSTELSQRLANDLKLNADKILENYKKRSKFGEGDIYSGYYHIPKDLDEEKTISLLYTLSQEKFKTFGKEYYKDTLDNDTLKNLLTIASIIQKETNDKEEMYLVSSVIQNRLNKNMKLQMDATLNYGQYAHKIITRERIREDNSTYNTYKHKGIPPAPLATVSIDALKAASHPATSDYLFFMLTPKGKHNFAATYKEHLVNIRTFRAAQEKKKKEKLALLKKKKKNLITKNTENNNTKLQIIKTIKAEISKEKLHKTTESNTSTKPTSSL